MGINTDPMRRKRYVHLRRRARKGDKEAEKELRLEFPPFIRLRPEERIRRLRADSLKQSRKLKQKKRALTDLIVGGKCIFCKFEKNLICHRKDGQKHDHLKRLKLDEFIEELLSNQYVRLCLICHKHVHWCMDHLKMDWAEIEQWSSKRGCSSNGRAAALQYIAKDPLRCTS